MRRNWYPRRGGLEGLVQRNPVKDRINAVTTNCFFGGSTNAYQHGGLPLGSLGDACRSTCRLSCASSETVRAIPASGRDGTDSTGDTPSASCPDRSRSIRLMLAPQYNSPAARFRLQRTWRDDQIPDWLDCPRGARTVPATDDTAVIAAVERARARRIILTATAVNNPMFSGGIPIVPRAFRCGESRAGESLAIGAGFGIFKVPTGTLPAGCPTYRRMRE